MENAALGSDIKQVIVIRRDLHMRQGKTVAQGAHAAMMFLVLKLASEDGEFSEAERLWFSEAAMKKVVLRCESEEELSDIERRCREEGLAVNVITDSGLTEFHGVPTKTCLAIGPFYSKTIDTITGELALL